MYHGNSYFLSPSTSKTNGCVNPLMVSFRFGLLVSFPKNVKNGFLVNFTKEWSFFGSEEEIQMRIGINA